MGNVILLRRVCVLNGAQQNYIPTRPCDYPVRCQYPNEHGSSYHIWKGKCNLPASGVRRNGAQQDYIPTRPVHPFANTPQTRGGIMLPAHTRGGIGSAPASSNLRYHAGALGRGTRENWSGVGHVILLRRVWPQRCAARLHPHTHAPRGGSRA